MWAPSMVHWSCADMFNLTELSICFSASEPRGYSASQNSEKWGSRVEQLAHLGTRMEKSLHHTLTWTAALDLWYLLKKEVKLSMFKQMLSMFSSYFLCPARLSVGGGFWAGYKVPPKHTRKEGLSLPFRLNVQRVCNQRSKIKMTIISNVQSNWKLCQADLSQLLWFFFPLPNEWEQWLLSKDERGLSFSHSESVLWGRQEAKAPFTTLFVSCWTYGQVVSN